LLLAVGALVGAIGWIADHPAIGFVGRWVGLVGLVAYALRRRSLTAWILVSMALGAEIGHDWPAAGQSARLLSQIFLRLIKTIIAPLLFLRWWWESRVIAPPAVGGWAQALLYSKQTTIALFIGLAAINRRRRAGARRPRSIAGVMLPQTAACDPDGVPETSRPSPRARTQIVIFSILFAISGARTGVETSGAGFCGVWPR
jgi:proton glutamate symport protein